MEKLLSVTSEGGRYWKAIELIIPATPLPQSRPRVLKSGITYNPQKQEKEQTQLYLAHQYPGCILCGPIKIDALFHFEPPISFSKKKRRQALREEWPFIHHVKKPDIDNLCKFLLDCLVGPVIKDDNQVFKLSAEKRYSPVNETRIMIYELQVSERG
jgi:Holliday junction resolvase RusA-like endonuclease